jgi:hypothetical protein
MLRIVFPAEDRDRWRRTGGQVHHGPQVNNSQCRRTEVPAVEHIDFLLQLARYTMAGKYVSAYAHSPNASFSFLDPKKTASLFVQYDVIFDEIRGKL